MEPQNNPYKPPESDTRVATNTDDIVVVSRWLRFANFLIDYVMQILLAIAFTLAVATAGGEIALAKLDNIPDVVFGLAAMLVYYVFMETLFSRTVGKFVTGTKVVNEDGGQPTFGQIIGRTFARMIPFEPFSFFSENARGWHDSLPGTYVTKCR
ncbi:MAG: RDD family protein [Gammaproteobacteria bacterium]|jgi:uncharacterized RDD family membrane protein YckC